MEMFFDFHVFVCTNRRADGHKRGSCAASGSEQLRDYMKAKAKELGIKKARINSAGCLDRCELGPIVVVYPQGTWYRLRNTDDVDAVLNAQLNGTNDADHLIVGPEEGPKKA